MNSNVGGACDEFSVYKGKNWDYLMDLLGEFIGRRALRIALNSSYSKI